MVSRTAGVIERCLLEESPRMEEMARLLRAILQELREQTEEGQVYPVEDTVTVANSPYRLEFPTPLFRLLLTNDGPNNLLFRVNGTGAWGTVVINETIPMTFIKGVIRWMQFRVAAGTAAFRLVGMY